MHRLQPILEQALGEKMALPERKLTSIEALIERFPDVEHVMIDGSERPIARPQDADEQKRNYSGKRVQLKVVVGSGCCCGKLRPVSVPILVGT